jgi:glycosyltransferase involved in cell wall biosynthesis
LKNILIVTTNYPNTLSPSSGSFVESQVKLLKSYGCQVTILICNFQPHSRKNVIKLIFNFLKDVRIDLESDLNYLTIKYFTLGTKLFHQKINFGLAGKWKEFDIIHAHDCIWAGFISMKIKERFGNKYVITSHVPFTINNCWLNYLITHQVFLNAGLIYTVCQQDENILKSVYSTKNIVNIGNFIDESIFTPSKRKKENLFTISMVASTSIRKNVPLFLNLIKNVYSQKNLLNNIFKVNLVLSTISDGIELNEIISLIDTLNLQNVINVNVNLNQLQVFKIYQSTDLLISTSRYETFGMTIAEALCMDIPVVIIKNGASEDFIPEGCGSVFLEKDFDKIVKKILEYVDNKITFNPYSGYNSIKSEFGRDAFYQKLILGYNQLLK